MSEIYEYWVLSQYCTYILTNNHIIHILKWNTVIMSNKQIGNNQACLRIPTSKQISELVYRAL